MFLDLGVLLAHATSASLNASNIPFNSVPNSASWRREAQSQFLCYVRKPPVFSPKMRALPLRNGHQQVHVNVADAAAHQPMAFQKLHGDLVARGLQQGSRRQSTNTRSRSFRLPQASSPKIMVCMTICSRRSKSASSGSPLRRWSIQTELSARIIQAAGRCGVAGRRWRSDRCRRVRPGGRRLRAR